MPLSREEIQVLLSAKSNLSPVVGRAVANLRRLQTRVRGITASLGKMTAAFSGINALSFTALTANGIRAGSEINKVASILQESGEDIQRTFLDIKAVNPAIELDQLQESVRTLSERFSEARQSITGDAADALGRLGVNLDIEGPLNQLEEVRKRFQEIKSTSEQIELGNILFGDEDGNAIVGYLRASAEQMERIREARERLGLIVDQEQLDNIATARRSLGQISSVVNQLSIALAGKVAPLLTDLAARFLAFVEANGGIVSLAEKLFDIVSDKLKTVGAVIGGVADFIRSTYAKLFNDLDAMTLSELRDREADLQRIVDAPFGGLFPGERADNQRQLDEVRAKIKAVEEGTRSLTDANRSAVEQWKELLKGIGSSSVALSDAQGKLSGTTTQLNNAADAAKRLKEEMPQGEFAARTFTPNIDIRSADTKRQEIDGLFSSLGLQQGDDEAFAQSLKPLDVKQTKFFKDAEKSAKSFREQLEAVASSMGNLAGVAQQSGSRTFQAIQGFSEAAAAAAALAAAVQAGQASAIGGPLAAIAAAASVAATFFKFVNAIKGISPGNAPTSPPSVGGAPGTSAPGGGGAGPQGGTQELDAPAAGDTTIVLNGRARYDADDLEELVRALNRSGQSRRIVVDRR